VDTATPLNGICNENVKFIGGNGIVRHSGIGNGNGVLNVHSKLLK